MCPCNTCSITSWATRIIPWSLESRPPRYLFGTKNYGEVRGGWYNRADGDPWDIFVPGYDHALPRRTPLQVADVLGVLMLENGNHKIAVRVPVAGYSSDRARREIRTYVHRYIFHLWTCEGC